MNIVEKVAEIHRRLECYFDDGDCGDWSAEELYGFLEDTIWDAVECAKLVETHIKKLEDDKDFSNEAYERAKNAYHNACACGCIHMNYDVAVLDEYFGIDFNQNCCWCNNERNKDDQDNQV